MTDWLPDDVLVALAAASAVAIALSCFWHHRRPAVAQHRPDDAPSIPVAEQKDHKSTRSKERRRRGKDPLRDLFKGGKKSQALLKAIKATDHDHTPPSADTLSASSTPANDTASSTSRSQSPEPAGDTARLGAESGEGSARSTTSTSAVTSAGDISDHEERPQTDAVRAHSVPLDSITTEQNDACASTIIAPVSEETSSPLAATACADTPAPQPRNSQAASTSGSCAKLVRARTKLRLSRMDPGVKSSLLSSTLPPLADSVASHLNSIHSTTSTHSTDGAGPSTPTNSRGSTPPPRSPSPSKEPSTQPLESAQAQFASMRSALEAARLREERLRAEAEQASKERDELRWGWNEDAGAWRRREAELQAQIHHLMQQLQAYVAVASFQAQPSAFSSPTSPHAHSSPRLQHHHPLASFPLPPAIQTQNSASAPAHVQALLASAPMLTSHPPGLVSMGSPLLWSGQGLCVPHRDARHGGRQTPDSSASGSSSRGRRRRRRGENAKSASDESSLGDWDGMEDGSGEEDTWEEEEDIFRNNVLADAILKRPESLRELSGSVGKRSGVGRVSSGGRPPMMDALKDPALEKPSSLVVRQ